MGWTLDTCDGLDTGHLEHSLPPWVCTLWSMSCIIANVHMHCLRRSADYLSWILQACNLSITKTHVCWQAPADFHTLSSLHRQWAGHWTLDTIMGVNLWSDMCDRKRFYFEHMHCLRRSADYLSWVLQA